MKLVQVFVLSTLVMFAAIRTRADGVPTDDARIIIGGDPAPSNCPAKSSPSFHFEITPKVNGGGAFTGCQNTTGETWVGLTISGKTKATDMGPLMFGSGSAFACNGTPEDTNPADIFTTCTILSDVKHSITFELTGGTISAGSGFFTNLSTDGDIGGNGTGGWDFHGKLTITPIVGAPEPGTLALVLAGLGGISFWRKRKTFNADS
jgi:hypothetical protein